MSIDDSGRYVGTKYGWLSTLEAEQLDVYKDTMAELKKDLSESFHKAFSNGIKLNITIEVKK